MPLYEYRCEACSHTFEKIQKFSDPHEDTCPKCGGGVKKLVSSPAIQFKGSGWYITDYAKKSSNDGGGAPAKKDTSSSTDKGDSSGSSSSTTTPTDSAKKD